MRATDWLLQAAKRQARLNEARLAGRYFGPSEEIQAARELADAIRNYEAHLDEEYTAVVTSQDPRR